MRGLPIAVLILACAICANASAAIWYVDIDNTSGTEDGTSWATAFKTIQAGVNAAATEGGEVWVAEGTYIGTGDNVVVMATNVHLYGGFNATESTRDQRNWTTHKTIINGEDTRRGAYCSSVINATLDAFTVTHGCIYGNGGGGMYNDNSSPGVINCTFSCNSASSIFEVPDSDAYGGGMYNVNSSSPTVTGCTFSENTVYAYDCCGGGSYGGGMYNNSSSPTVTNCTFSGNFVYGYYDCGGGMYNLSSSPTITNCTFSFNRTAFNSSGGGGMYNDSSSPMLTDCTFSGNRGGGMLNDFSSPTLTNCTFSGNEDIGGMYNFHGLPIVTNCTFSGNSTYILGVDGGGMSNNSSSPMVTNCTFSGNRANSLFGGGGMYNGNGSPTVTNCTFSGNKTTSEGGGMLNYGSSPMVTNCTFSGNMADYGGGGMNNQGGSPTVTNCILWGDTPDEIYGSPTVTYSCVQMPVGVYPGDGNIADNPSFVDAVNGDLRLNLGSPCINTGTAIGAPSADILGVLRPQGRGFDMGAYEYVFPPIIITQQPQSQTVPQGQPATFTIGVSGGVGPITYQWQWDGGDIEEENASVYTIGSAQMGNEGSYTCHLEDDFQELDSDLAILAVIPGTMPLAGGFGLAALLSTCLLAGGAILRRKK